MEFGDEGERRQGAINCGPGHFAHSWKGCGEQGPEIEIVELNFFFMVVPQVSSLLDIIRQFKSTEQGKKP